MQDQSLAAYEAYRSRSYFASLNGIRFLCIAAVMWHHAPIFGQLETPATLLTRGFTGVDFFFVLSGYLITTLLLREQARTGRISLTGFYWRRALRILPIYFLVITVVAVYLIVLNGRTEYLGLLPYYYLFLSNFLGEHIPFLGITWSLAVEEQYYLFWPALLIALPTLFRVRVGVLVALIAICAFGSVLFYEQFLVAPLGASYAAILIGSLTALLLHEQASFRWLYRLVHYRVAPLIFLISVLLVLQFAPPILLGWPNLLLHLAMALCVAAVVVREDHVLRPVLTWPPIARVGEISYGIYLYHVFVRFLTEQGLEAFGMVTAQAALLVSVIYPFATIVVADISFRTYERFFLSLKDRPRARNDAARQS